MIKVVIAVVLIFAAGGAWLYMDCLNQHEQGVTEQMHQGVDQARAEAKRRAEAKAIMEYQIQATLTSCQAAAGKAKSDYMLLIQKAVPPTKRGPAVIPQAVVDEAEMLLTTAKAECQQAHDTRLKNGQ
jgi:hypothetical protein